MSLINEALKRTRDASYQVAVNPPGSASGYRIGGAATSPGSVRSGIGTTLVVATLALTVGAMFATRFVKHARAINAGFDDVVEAMATPAPAPVAAQKPTVAPPVPAKPSSADAKA